MEKRVLLAFLFLLLFTFSEVNAQRRSLQDSSLKHVELKVGELDREYLLYIPDELDSPAPVVFGFHGHGGSARNAARSFQLHRHWPQSIVVYMQGIPTPGKLTDPDGKRNGWQHEAGEQADRDLKFFDAVLTQLKSNYPVDQTRIYSTGHSNGGKFTYLLWGERGNLFAAVAPSAAVAGKGRSTLVPKPVMHLAGEKDLLVRYSWQAAMMRVLRRLNQCEVEGEDWGQYSTLYPSKLGTPVVTYIHPGTHKYPREASPLIIKFFKEHQLKMNERQIQKDAFVFECP